MPPTQQESFHTWLVLLPATPAKPHLVLNLIGLTFLQVDEIIQTNQAYPPMGTRDHLTLLILQSLPPTAPVGSLYSECNVHMDLHGLWCPYRDCEYM